MGDTTKEVLGEYELLQLIGDGAQGKVFKARRLGVPGQFFAVKVLRFSGEDEKKVSRFNQSAATLQKLQHPAIVSYLGSYTWHAGEWDEAHCLVMEYLDGESLDDVIRKFPRGLPWLEVRRIFETCLEGLIYAREQGLVHRDIKPSNIFITRDGKVKLIDFDIAKRDDGSQTSTAGWKGTFDYMAPDFVQVTNFRGDDQSDIFSLGVCLFQAMTGRLPFPPLGEGAHIGYLTRWRDPAGVKPVMEGGLFRVLVNIKPVLTKSLHPDRASRFPTFVDMLAAVRAVEFRRLEHKGGATYEMIDWLGRGGFGEVYLGRRVSDGLQVAIKRLHSAQYSDRFIREARIVQKYPHDALVKYVDFIETEAAGGERQCFLMMEYLEGMPRLSLRNRLLDSGPMPVREAVELFIRFLSGLQFLHENPRPIIHRDIKPANLYAPAGRPEAGRIFDLGIARDVAGTATSGGIPGTLDYMAPEFATAGGDRGTPQTDVFAMSLCLYEALTGRTALERLPSDLGQAWVRFQQRSVEPLKTDFSADVFVRWPTLADILRLGLTEKPEDRPSAGEMRQMLESVLPQLPRETSASAPSPTCTAIFQRGDDLSAGYAAASEPGKVAEEPQTAKTVGVVEGSPQAAAVDAFVEAKKTERSRSWLAVVVAAVAVLAAGAWFYFQKARHEGGAVVVTAPPGDNGPASSTSAVPAIPAATAVVETAFMLDPRFAQPVAGLPYLKDLTAEIARIGRAVDNGELRASAVRPALETLNRQAAGLPQQFRSAFDAALATKDFQRASAVAEEWASVGTLAETMGLTLAEVAKRASDMRSALASRQLDEDLAALRSAIPANPNAPGAWTEAEAAAVRLDGIVGRDWPGLSAEERDARISSVASALRAVVEVRVSGAAASSDLDALRKQAPQLTRRFTSLFDAQATALMQSDHGRELFRKEVDALMAAVPAEAASAAELARAEDVASKLLNLPARSIVGVTDVEKQAAVLKVKESLLPALGAAVANLRMSALDKARTAATVEEANATLVDLGKRYPNVTALVATSHRKALQEVEAAWKSRPPPPKPVMPVTPAVVTSAPPVVAVVTDPNEEELIRVLLAGGQAFAPKGATTIDAVKAGELLAAAAPVRLGFNAMDLMISPKSGQDYLAAVGDLWKKASAFNGAFGARLKDAAWKVTHDQLAKAAEGTVKGMIAARPPVQQARIRREFIKLLTHADEITGRVSACTPQDVLRARVSLYFEEGFFNDALLTEKVGNDAAVEARIPWIKESFDKLRSRRGISASST